MLSLSVLLSVFSTSVGPTRLISWPDALGLTFEGLWYVLWRWSPRKVSRSAASLERRTSASVKPEVYPSGAVECKVVL
jgi:hypothetical protein